MVEKEVKEALNIWAKNHNLAGTFRILDRLENNKNFPAYKICTAELYYCNKKEVVYITKVSSTTRAVTDTELLKLKTTVLLLLLVWCIDNLENTLNKHKDNKNEI